ncbi:hypothetical protein ACLOJK_010610 [Asimina triloba]
MDEDLAASEAERERERERSAEKERATKTARIDLRSAAERTEREGEGKSSCDVDCSEQSPIGSEEDKERGQGKEFLQRRRQREISSLEIERGENLRLIGSRSSPSAAREKTKMRSTNFRRIKSIA